jgi:hypothetical protein
VAAAAMAMESVTRKMTHDEGIRREDNFWREDNFVAGRDIFGAEADFMAGNCRSHSPPHPHTPKRNL